MNSPILQMNNIHKFFGTQCVLKDVSLNLYKGKVMGLMGENGAGKSTLMKILGGLEYATEGTIYLNKQEFHPKNSLDAETNGLVIIHQELNLFDEMSIMDNVFLGSEILNRFSIDYKKQYQIIVNLFNDLEITLDPYQTVKNLSIGQKQLVEITKALHKNAAILVMDEPTSALSEDEINKVFKIIRVLKSKGTSVVYISHRMQEVYQICDFVTILRDGQFIGEFPIEQISENQLIEYMVGRNIDDPFPYIQVDKGEELLLVENISNDFIKDISFSLHRGEILGVGGLMGAGRTYLAHVLYGLAPLEKGSIYIDGKKVSITHPNNALHLGVSYVSEDRKKDGLFINFSVLTNITLPSLHLFEHLLKYIQKQKEKLSAEKFAQLTKIKSSSIDATVGELSGGNQQKVALAKALLTNPQILILDEPTRGIDIGARREIYQLINEFKQKGTAIILISSDMPELLSLSDRVLVMSEGLGTGILEFHEKSPENVMKLAVNLNYDEE